jgi:hypothetical protein
MKIRWSIDKINNQILNRFSLVKITIIALFAGLPFMTTRVTFRAIFIRKALLKIFHSIR